MDALQGQTMQIALLGEPGTKQEISEFVDFGRLNVLVN